MGGCSETSANCVINDIITENRNQQVLNQNEKKGRVKNNRNKCQIIMLYALNLQKVMCQLHLNKSGKSQEQV